MKRFYGTIILSIILLAFAGGVVRAFQIRRSDHRMVDIELNPMVELDFKSKSEVLKLRKEYVLKHPELLSGPYQPSEAVFGQIQDNKSWWGILGLCYYGPGKRSIEGPAEESRFIANPFLLIGLDTGRAHIIRSDYLGPKPIYPAPVKLQWRADHTVGLVTYNVSGYVEEANNYRYQDINEMYLVAYNAEDLGFHFCYFDRENASNITLKNPRPGRIIKLRQMLHCGGSSGYPGGSNNMSPRTPELEFFYTLPAKISVKLWKKMPSGYRQPADMTFIIEMK